MSETPQDRLNRLIARRAEQAKHYDSGKKSRKVRRDVPPVVGEALRRIVDSLKEAIGGEGEIEVRDLTRGPGFGVVEITGKKNPPPLPDADNMISMHIDLSALSEIDDEKTRDHAHAMIKQHSTEVVQLSNLDPDSPLPQFVQSVGQIIVQGGMAGAMIVAGKAGRPNITPPDFQAAMVGSAGGMVLSALRYGQRHPEALTMADGVDDAQLSNAVDQFLANLDPGANEEEEGKE